MNVESIKAVIKEIDNILDDESISDEDFDQLNKSIQVLTKILGELENKQSLKNCKEFNELNEWTKTF